MSDLRVLVANCLVGGDKVTEREESWIRNIVEFDCAGRSVVCTQRDDIALGQVSGLVGRFADTSEFVLRNVPQRQLRKSLILVERLCWLLSFASMSKVLWYGYDYPDGTPRSYRRSAVGSINGFRPVFNVRDVTSIQNFVRQVFSRYVHLEKSRKLNVVIDYLLIAEERNRATEGRLLLIFVVLENLKDTYARSKSIPYSGGYYRKSTATNSPRYTFEELLSAMLMDVGMRKDLKSIIRLRNELIHSGLSRLPHASQRRIYERAQDLVREYMLRLLGYRGSFLAYSSRGDIQRTVQHVV
ncbi:MAG: hypothetical protein IT469_01000 [Pseudomonadales bacterium]|nr:hypothetical protein [Pseudomonadales bacterium]